MKKAACELALNRRQRKAKERITQNEKYAIPAALLLLGNEIISLAMLTVMVFMFIADVMKGAPTP